MSRKYFIIASVVCSIVIVIFLILLNDTEKDVGDVDNKLDSLVSAEQALDDFEESIEYALASYEDLLERFSSDESVNYDEAHKFILKHLKSAYPDIKRKRKKLHSHIGNL